MELLVILCVLIPTFAREQWIDPHDMTVDATDFSVTNNAIAITNKEGGCDCSKCAENTLHVHYKRTIGLLLNAVKSGEVESLYKGVIEISIQQDDYNFLKNIVQSSTDDVAHFKRVNSILENVLSKSVYEKTSDNIMGWLEWLYFTFYNYTTGIAIVGLFVTWVSYKLLQAKLTIWKIVTTLLLFAWVVDLAFTWIHLIQEAEIEKISDSFQYKSASACDPSKMAWWQYVWNAVSSKNECQQYHRTMLQNVFWKVSPFTVFAYQFGVLIATPANNIGKAFGSLITGILDELPFGMKYLLLPLILIFFLVAVCILLSFLTKTAFEINFLHLFSLKLGGKEHRMIGNLFSLSDVIAEVSERVRRPKYLKQKEDSAEKLCSSREPEPSAITFSENNVYVEDVKEEMVVMGKVNETNASSSSEGGASNDEDTKKTVTSTTEQSDVNNEDLN